MFGIGTWEWVLIIIIALVFLGPDKLPEVARSAGKGMRAVRRALRGLEDEVGDLTRPMADLDPRRVFEDAVREQTQGPPPDPAHAPPAPAADQPPPPEGELGPEDIAGAAAEDEADPPLSAPGVAPVAPMEADGRVASAPPLARPAPAAAPAHEPNGAPADEPADQPEGRA